MGRFQAEAWVRLHPMEAFDLWVNPVRAPQWSEHLLGVIDIAPDVAAPGATYRLDYGPGLKRSVTVLTSRRGEIYRVRASGAGWTDETTVSFVEENGGTRITYEVDLQMGWGWLGRLFEKRMGRAGADEKLRQELDRFVRVAGRAVPSAEVGSVMSADCGTGFRIVQLLADDGEVLHFRLLPGVAKHRPQDVRELTPARNPPDPLAIHPLSPRLSSVTDKVTAGQHALALDGGHGVAHIAITRGAFADAYPEVVGSLPVDPVVQDEIASWRANLAPVVGQHPDVSIGPLVSYAKEGGLDGVTAFGVAKLLKVERLTVHMRLYSNSWTERPSTVNPWALRLDPAWSNSPGIGHMPASLRWYFGMQPTFVRLAMVSSAELEGYRLWKDAGGGSFGARDSRSGRR